MVFGIIPDLAFGFGGIFNANGHVRKGLPFAPPRDLDANVPELQAPSRDEVFKGLSERTGGDTMHHTSEPPSAP